jgi:(R,R)-butanediol dehydrogenase/meso-butanediol dehydrogenase/diacetyl reductase
MRAAVYYGAHDVRIEEVSDPAEPGPGELLLRVRACSICGTDVSEYLHGPLMIPLAARHPASGHLGPTILGHEFVGEVVAVGDGTALFTGQRVVAGAGNWCGACRWCLEGRPNLCIQYFVYGLHAPGGLASYVRVPSKMCHAVPEGCPDEWAAMAQPCAIALHAARRSGAGPGDTVVLIGAGGIGSFLLAALRALGVDAIIALDVSQERLDTAGRLGASSLLAAQGQPQALLEEIRAVTAGQGADVVIEASGAPTATSLALSLVRRGGRVLQVGLPAEPVPLPLRQFVVPEIDLVTTNGHVCGADLPQALGLLATTDLARIVLDRVISLDALVDEGLLALAERRARGKIVIALP